MGGGARDTGLCLMFETLETNPIIAELSNLPGEESFGLLEVDDVTPFFQYLNQIILHLHPAGSAPSKL